MHAEPALRVGQLAFCGEHGAARMQRGGMHLQQAALDIDLAHIIDAELNRAEAEAFLATG